MNKAFSRVNWKNLPNRSTPLSEVNLNRSDSALDIIDNRVITLDTTKANLSELSSLFKDISFNTTTGTFIFTRYDNSTVIVDTNLEKIAVNFRYDSENRQLVLYDSTGAVIDRVDLSDFITINEFTDSSTIAFTLDGTEVSADIKNGSITGEKLQPDYLADITEQASSAGHSMEVAADAATDATDSATFAQSYAKGGTGTRENEDTDNAKYYKEQAERYATSDYALEAESYAKGGTGYRPDEDTDNAKYYKEIAEQNTITNITATIDGGYGEPSVDVEQTSSAPNKSFRFDFHNLKGDTGDKGDTGVSVSDSYITDDDHLIFVYDDGSELDAGVIGTNIRQMTLAEYEALSDEEKSDPGLYFWITDADGGTVAIVVSSVTSYSELTGKPSINNVVLQGNKSLSELGITSLVEITQLAFDALSQAEKDNPSKWYWIV